MAHALLAAAWIGLAISGKLDGYGLSAAFAVLVAFPLAVALDRGVPAWVRAWIVGLAAATLPAFLLPRGPVAAGWAAGWLAATGVYAAYGFVRFANGDKRAPWTWAEAAGAVGPVVAAVALVTSRLDGTFAGFGEPLATLTVTHFHYTFGLLPLTFAALARAGLAPAAPLWGVVFAPVLVGALFAARADVAVPSVGEAGATLLLALAVAGVALGAWPRLGRLPAAEAAAARLAAVVLTACVALGAAFSVTLAAGAPLLDFDGMLRWHGVGNAVATVVLGGVALRHARFAAGAPGPTEPDLAAATRDVDPARALFRDARPFDLGPDAPGRFEALAGALLRYRFYPPSVMVHRTTFPDRHARVGDRIGMTLLVPLLPGLPPFGMPATTEVIVAEAAADRAAFGYRTTTAHYGKGAWSATLTRADGRIRLLVESRMTPTHPLAVLGLPLYRFLQKRAHGAGAENLGRIA